MRAGMRCALFWLPAILGGCVVYPVMGRRGPGPLVVVAEPRLVLVEGTSIQYCPDLDDDVFLFGGIWYTYRSGLWYSCPRYTGPWVVVERGRLPVEFFGVPPSKFKHRPEYFH